ncbi:unnamed protein product [Bursaphelenchus xylophilus]|uniref:(pine wood nematode) hypothetical protein n=1 Tax=Bursaphelenchus xylophilus TaxID=6326 RepID=A0A7I8WQQ2_BURXY|nr:unnamed protein product [Bursaphelenchus xylophilus]CAG9096929.1 unnamed protein product [Bursaphelenchus xylophilus]
MDWIGREEVFTELSSISMDQQSGFETRIRGLQRTVFHEEDLSSSGYVLSEQTHLSSPELEAHKKPTSERVNSVYSSDLSELDYLPDLNMHYAETEIHPSEDVIESQREEGLFTSLRHQSHYFSNIDLFQQEDLDFNYLKYAKAGEIPTTPTSSPHLRIMNLCFDLDPRSTFDKVMLRSAELRRVLSHITLELFAGDMLCFLYTSESEMETFIRVLSRSDPPPGQTHGIFELNGHKLKPSQFGERVAHVTASDVKTTMTLIEYLNSYSTLVKPATSSFKRHEMIIQLIQGLALTPFKGQLVQNLGRNEINRLKIASAMLLDTDILVCENILRDMDLYDMAFIIDFIRDWAQKKKKIAIIALNPPTLEILQMFGKVSLMTCGRFVYMGESSEMCDYFESIGYTSPPFKNPCDYYVDLVTHDVLNNESAKESMIRIRTLTEVIFRCLWLKAFNNPISVCWETIINLILSLFLGWLFFQLPLDRRAGINDRQGFICSVLLIVQFPLSLLGTRCLIRDMDNVQRDMMARKYSRHNYLAAMISFDLPFVIVSSIAYSMPMYTLTSQNPATDSDLSSLISFSILILINILFFRYLAWVSLFTTRNIIFGLLANFFLFMMAVTFSGFVIHPEDQFMAIVQFYNPVRLLGADLLRLSFLGKSNTSKMISWVLDVPMARNNSQLLVDCHKKKVLATKLKQIPIYTVTQCLKTTGAEAFLFSGFSLYSMDMRHVLFVLTSGCPLVIKVIKMGKKKKEVEMENVIPLKPTANITNLMRAEKTPEKFDNVVIPPKKPENLRTSEKPNQRKQNPPSKRSRPSAVVLTGRNEVVEFPVNIVGTISQSSGTVSYDSFKELNGVFLETLKKQKPVEQKDPGPTFGEEVKVQTKDEIPNVEIIDDVKFCRSLRKTHQDPPFELIPSSPEKHRGIKEHELAKKIVEDVMREFMDSGRHDLEIVIDYNPTEAYPILNMTFEKKSG